MLNDRAGELTEVGGRAFIKTKPGRSGIAVYGPYETIQPGAYKVEFHIEALGEPSDERDPLYAVADIIAGPDVTLADVLVFRSQVVEGDRFTLYFETTTELHGVEYRIYVNGVEPILLGDVPSAIAIGAVQPPEKPIPLAPLYRTYTDRIKALFFAGIGIAAFRRELIATVSDSWFHLRKPEDFANVDELILRHNFSILQPLPVCVAGDDASAFRSAPPVIVFGAGAAFSSFGFSLVGYVLDVLYGEHRRIHCATLSDLRQQWGEQKGRPVLVVADRPDAALSMLLTTSGFNLLAFLDTASEAVVYRVVVDKFPLPEAIRVSTQSFSCLAGCIGADTLTIVDGADADANIAQIVEAVCTAMGVETNTDFIAKVLDRVLTEEGLNPDATAQDVKRTRLNGESYSDLISKRFDLTQQTLIRWFEADYGPQLQRVGDNPIEWPREMFFVGAEGKTAEVDIDLIGGARHIVWGPYFHLPVGGWRARIQFEVADNFSGNEIEGDVWTPMAATEIASCTAKLPVHGYFQFTLDFIVTDPRSPIEIRVRLVKGAIEGLFGLRRVTLQPIASLSDLATLSAMTEHKKQQKLAASPQGQVETG